MVSHAQDSAIDEIKEQMGLTHSEAFDLVETYKTYAQQANVFDPERERSIILSKLERLTQTCDEAGMVTTQLNTHKVVLQVLGLTRHEEDTNIDRRASLEGTLEAEIIKDAKDVVPVKAAPAIDTEE